MTLKEFISKYSGVKKVGNTEANKGECVGLAMVYVSEVLKLSHVWGHARDIFTNAPTKEWEKIKNAPKAYPMAGDVICWDKTTGGGFGHIAIVISSVTSSDPLADTFTVFEQNSPLGSTPHITTYKSWKGVIGWLRPINKPVEPPTIDPCAEKVKILEEERKTLRKTIRSLESELKKKSKEITRLETKIAELRPTPVDTKEFLEAVSPVEPAVEMALTESLIVRLFNKLLRR